MSQKVRIIAVLSKESSKLDKATEQYFCDPREVDARIEELLEEGYDEVYVG